MKENEFRDYYGDFEELSNAYEQWRRTIEPINDKFKNVYENVEKIFAPIIEVMKPLEAFGVLGKFQFTYWRALGKDDVERLLSKKDINRYLEERIEDPLFYDLDNIIKACEKTDLLSETNGRIFSQGLEITRRGFYDLAILGFAAVIDGALSAALNNPSSSFWKRTEIIENKIRDKSNDMDNILDEDIVVFGTYYTWMKTMKAFQVRIEFSEPEAEPQNLNRHWVAHGRKTTEASKLDCYKMIGILYGLILLAEVQEWRTYEQGNREGI